MHTIHRFAETVARRLLVTGDVQGVGFRAGCRDAAVRFGVVGTVRNLDDGRVEVVCAGERQAVGRLVDWCREGPPGSQVDGVGAEEVDPDSVDADDFRIIR